MQEKKKHFLIIDSNSVIHRAFHALPCLTTKNGQQVNAVYGVLLVLFKVIKEFQPDYIAACFDFPAPTFRHQKFKEYKAKRPPTAKELVKQIPIVKNVLTAFNIEIFEKEGFEADDIIGTLALRAAKFSIFPPAPTLSERSRAGNFQIPKKENLETIILTGDQDILQLVDKDNKVYLLRKGVKDIILYDENLIKEKYQGLIPGQLIDFKALRGDPSDNIPGVKGIGEKTALRLIGQFGSLEGLYKGLEGKIVEAETIKSKLREILLSQKEQAFFSKSLVQLNQQAPIDFSFEKVQWKDYDKEKAAQILKSLEFYSLIEKLPACEKQAGGLKENLKLW